jgi:ethanolamine utilization protein EutN
VRIGDVVGNVTLNRWHPSLTGASFKLVAPLGWDDLAQRSPHTPCADVCGGTRSVPPTLPPTVPLEEIVVFDELGAGVGSRVAISEGREAAMPFHPEIKPVDAYNAAILDHLDYDSW